jgi:DNA-binding response OmpR family regulator
MEKLTMKTLPGITVLVVDDEPDLRDLLAYEFEEMGCTVLQAESGRDGARVYDSNKIDVVVSDIRMPGGSGLDLLDHVRDNAKGTMPPFFLITGFADVSEEQALEKGARRLFHKPFDIDEIMDAVRASVQSGAA